MPWLMVSIVLSVVLTVVLNVGLRVFPDLGRRVQRGLDELASRNAADARTNGSRVFIPWKAMLLASAVLTVVVNLVLRIL